MIKRPLVDRRIQSRERLVSPKDVKAKYLASDSILNFVTSARESLEAILEDEDQRYILIVGPCSIHCKESALEYANKLKALSEKVADVFEIVMRVYFEKPRTSLGWQGLINDPWLNGSYDVDYGIGLAREILLEINQLELSCATEALNPILAQYWDDLVSWAAIGARTVESQIHRQLASGLSCPIGFKNTTTGEIRPVINAIKAANSEQHFIGMNPKGETTTYYTRGNRFCHAVLRGSDSGPNYQAEYIEKYSNLLSDAGLFSKLMIDCSHGNSSKEHERQAEVFKDCIQQLKSGNSNIFGIMLESNLKSGKQALGDNPGNLEYGLSITDACLGWEQTEKLILAGYDCLKLE